MASGTWQAQATMRTQAQPIIRTQAQPTIRVQAQPIATRQQNWQVPRAAQQTAQWHNLFYTGTDDPRSCVVIGEDSKPHLYCFDTTHYGSSGLRTMVRRSFLILYSLAPLPNVACPFLPSDLPTPAPERQPRHRRHHRLESRRLLVRPRYNRRAPPVRLPASRAGIFQQARLIPCSHIPLET